MLSEPQQEHRWLEQLLGEWTCESVCQMGPDQPPMTSTGRETVRSFGGLWTIGEGSGGTTEGTWHAIMTLGYDPRIQRFVGTFIATMMTHLWVYNGGLDATGKILTLDAEGPNFTDGSMMKYQDIIEIISPDERTLSSRMQLPDGTWQHFMKATYRRVA